MAVSTACPSEDRYTSIWCTSLCGRQYGVSIRGPVYVYLVYIIMWPVSKVCPSEDRYTSIWCTSLCGRQYGVSIRGPLYVYLVYIIMWPSVRCVHQRTAIRLSGVHHYVSVSTACPSEDRYTSIWCTSLCGRQYGVSIRGPVYVYLVYIIMWPSVRCVHQRTAIRLSGVHHYVAVSTVCPSEDRYTSIWSTSLCAHLFWSYTNSTVKTTCHHAGAYIDLCKSRGNPQNIGLICLK